VSCCENIDQSYDKRSRGRPNESWSEVIRHDFKTLGLVEDTTQDIRLCRIELKLQTLDSVLPILPLDLEDIEVVDAYV